MLFVNICGFFPISPRNLVRILESKKYKTSSAWEGVNDFRISFSIFSFILSIRSASGFSTDICYNQRHPVSNQQPSNISPLQRIHVVVFHPRMQVEIDLQILALLNPLGLRLQSIVQRSSHKDQPKTIQSL